MGRRKRDDGLADVLILLPWWVSVGLGCVGFVAMRWIIPSGASNNIFLKALAPALQSIAWLPLVFFGFIGLLAFARSKAAPSAPSASSSKVRSIRPKAEPAVSLPLSRLNAEWGRSLSGQPEPATVVKSLNQWTLESLRDLEWKRFELLCAKYYEAVGFKSETIRCGADGGIDVKLFRVDPDKPLAIVQCKAWNSAPVGVKEIRELLGVMTSEKVGRGIFITTSSYTKDAFEFGTANPIQLLDGPGFLKKIQELSKDRQDALLKFAFEGDYKTPTCASCGIKMVKREGKRGVFWGCLNYPRCKSTFVIRT